MSTNPFREDLLQYWKYEEVRLVTPTSSTVQIVKAASKLLDKIFIQGLQYKRGGVIVMGITPNSPIQQDLFDVSAEQIEKMNKLDKVIDRINKRYGSETVVIGSQQYTQKDVMAKAAIEREQSQAGLDSAERKQARPKVKAAIEREQSQAGLDSAERKQARPKVKAEVFANAIKHDFKSKNPTTRWSDIIKLK